MPADSPQIAADSNGNFIAVWRQAWKVVNGTRYGIYASRYALGTGWDAAAVVYLDTSTNDITANADPQIAVDPTGNAVAVWSVYDWTWNHTSVRANRYVVGTGWAGVTNLSTEAVQIAYSPNVAIDATGNALVVWSQDKDASHPDYGVRAVRYAVGTGWGTPALIESATVAATRSGSVPQIAFDPNGNAIAAWYQYGKPGIYANRYAAGTGWGTPEAITDPGTPSYDEGVQIAVDKSGNAIAVWNQYGGVTYANRYVVGTGWGTTVIVDPNGGQDYSGKIAFDQNGNAIAVWGQFSSNSSNIWANLYTVGTGWGAVSRGGSIVNKTLDGTSEPQLVIDKNGNATAAWLQSGSIYAATSTTSSVTFALTMAVSPESSGTTTPTGATNVLKSAATNITATPATGYTFSSWTANPTDGATFASATTANTTVTLTADATVTANFTKGSNVNLTMAASPTTGGATTPTGTTSVAKDATTNITATAATGYAFSSWTANPTANATFGSASSASTTVKLSTDATVTANFTSSATYAVSGKITLGSTSAPAAGEGLSGVTVSDGTRSATTGSDGSYAISGAPNGAYTITPTLTDYTFSPATQSVTVSGANKTDVNFTAYKGTVKTAILTMAASPSAGGSTTPSGSSTVVQGASTSITATAATGYVFSSWSASPSANATIASASSASTTVSLTADATVTATFIAKPSGSYSVTFTAGAGGSLTGTTTQVVTSGGSCAAVTAVADTGYSFSGWTGDYTGTNNPLTVTNVTKDMAIMANFTQGGSSGELKSAQVGSTHSETYKCDKSTGGVPTVISKDTYLFSAKVKLPDEFDLSTIDGATAIYITVGNDYTFTSTLSEAVKSKLDKPEKGGGATFQICETNEKGKTVVTETNHAVLG